MKIYFFFNLGEEGDIVEAGVEVVIEEEGLPPEIGEIAGEDHILRGQNPDLEVIEKEEIEIAQDLAAPVEAEIEDVQNQPEINHLLTKKMKREFKRERMKEKKVN